MDGCISSIKLTLCYGVMKPMAFDTILRLEFSD